jgi:hypothetical protein
MGKERLVRRLVELATRNSLVAFVRVVFNGTFWIKNWKTLSE